MNEQILKRLQDTMKMLSVVLEQLEQLLWLTKDIIEDLELELNPNKTVAKSAPTIEVTTPIGQARAEMMETHDDGGVL